MDFLDLAAARYSCRKYDGSAVDKVQLLSCLEAARLAPSGCNSQPWHFYVVTEPQTRQKMGELTHVFPGQNVNLFTEQAGALVLATRDAEPNVFPRVAEKYGHSAFSRGDVGRAVGFFCMRAAELGLGTCIIGVFDSEEMRRLLDIPPERIPELVIVVGHPAEPEREHSKKRHALEDIATFIE